MAKIRSAVNISPRYFHSDIKYISNATLMIFIKHFCVLKMAIAIKWLNGTTEVVWDIALFQTIPTQTFQLVDFK